MQVLFRVVAQVPVCLPKLSHLLSAECLFRNQFESQGGQFLLCVVSLGCAVEAKELFSLFPSYSRPRESSARQVSGPLVMLLFSISLSQKRDLMLVGFPLVCLPSAGNLRSLAGRCRCLPSLKPKCSKPFVGGPRTLGQFFERGSGSCPEWSPLL